jgi:WD40 repeat protein
LKYPYSEKYYATKALFSPDGSFIVVSITDYLTHLEKPNSYLLVWDVSTGELQQEWVQEYAVMSAYDGFGPEPRVYTIPVDAMAFFPASTKLAYANGNRIEIRDVLEGGESTGWSLGDTMYASEMSMHGDGEILYILMRWYKDMNFPALYRYKFTAQIWHPATKSLRREIKFEEVYPGKEDVWLVGQYLLHQDTITPELEALDLSTDEKRDFPYRIGSKYFNQDASMMLVSRLAGVDEDKESLELWKTDTWRNVYTFEPNFGDEWYFLSNIVFNPDNSLLAIEYDGQVSLWDIRSVQP